jgi:eukaryotic-like serine/threonine-protein kinase
MWYIPRLFARNGRKGTHREGRGRRLPTLLVEYALLAVALTLTAGLSALVTMRVALLSQEVSVPSLVGRRVPEAGPLAARHGLQVRVEGRRNDPRVPRDAVVTQEPPAGSTLKANRSIRVWLSLGPKRIEVPGVEGQSLRAGRLALEQAQIPVARVVNVRDAAEEGTILVQRPRPGEAESAPEGASFMVSAGPGSPAYVMPDLIGRKSDRVLPLLQGAGLRVTQVRYRPYPGVEAGIILRQTPPAGHRVRADLGIELDVSRSGE